MPLSGSAFWAVVVPVGDRTNLLSNPSFERGTQGWGTIQAGTIGTTSAFQQFGAWSGSVAPTSNGTTGAISPTFTAGDGTRYTFSAYVRGQSGIPYKIGVGDSNGVSLVGSTNFTGGGTWHRYSGTWVESGGATRRMVIQKAADADTNAFYIDGAQVEPGLLTTAIDGDQDGCYWLGLPHQSQSTRSGTYRGGGSVVALADLGLRPNEHMGIGMPPQEVTSQSYALQPGAEYQRSRASERPFTLSFQPIFGTTMKDYHVTRRVIENAIKPDLLDPQQPVRFWYTGGQGTVQIDAVYSSGMELTSMNGPMAEEGAIKFIAHNPYWYATTQEGTALAGRVNLGSTNYLAKRSPLGVWGTLGNAGSTTNSAVEVLTYANGTLYVGGQFGSAGGTLTGSLIFYRTDADRFGTFGGTVQTANGVQAIAVSADGTVYFGGAFTQISGLSNTRFIARWANGFATITGGTVNNAVNDMAWSGGSLWIAGAFTGVAGTTTGQLAFWRPAGYGSTSNGTIATEVFGITVGLNRRVYVGFQAAGAVVAGTAGTHVAQYFGSWGTMGAGMEQTGAGVQTMATGPSGIIYAAGEFLTAGGGSALNIAQWNGQQWFPMGSGVGQDAAGVIEVQKVVTDQQTGDVYAVGAAVNSPFTFPNNQARWNGYTWLPMDIVVAGVTNTLALAPDRTLYIGGNFSGTADAASVATLVNTGMGDAYPTLKIRNTSGTTRRLYQIANTLTGDALYFNQTFEPGEELTMVTEPGQRSFTSSFTGNILGNILPGSNIASFRLLSGTNYLSFFCDSGSVAASVYWQPRSDSVDGGTVY